MDPISRLRQRIPIQDGPLTNLSKPLTLKTDDDPLKNLYKEISDRFEEYFERGLAVVGVERSADAGTYLFGRWG